MSAREELASALVDCLRDVSSQLEHAYTAAVRQQDALTKSDMEAIAEASAAQEDILRRIAQADERAAAVAAMIADENGLGADSAGINSIADVVGQPYASHVSRELSQISRLSRNVRDMHTLNRTLLRNGLDVITQCLRTVVQQPEPVVYSRSASFAGAGSGVLSLDSRV